MVRNELRTLPLANHGHVASIVLPGFLFGNILPDNNLKDIQWYRAIGQDHIMKFADIKLIPKLSACQIT